MRDSRESRLLLVLLIVIAFALLTLDIHTGSGSPLAGARKAVAAGVGPAERGVGAVVKPVGDAIDAVRTAGSSQDEKDDLRRKNADLKRQLGNSPLASRRQKEMDRLLKVAGAGRYRIKPAQVVGVGASKGFSWTVTLDLGSKDGIERDMTVINGDGLVGRVTTVSPGTATVLLANDPSFTVGARLGGSGELGFATGQGESPMKMQLLNSKAKVKRGDRLVTFGSRKGKPFVPGVPIGKVRKINATPGSLTRTVEVAPFPRFTALDLVGVVVQPPRKNPRDAVLPPKPSEHDHHKDTKAEEKSDKQKKDRKKSQRAEQDDQNATERSEHGRDGRGHEGADSNAGDGANDAASTAGTRG